MTGAHLRGLATHGMDEATCGFRWHGDNWRRSDRPGRNDQAFKGAWPRRVRSARGIDVPRALRQEGLTLASAPLTGVLPD
jgi:hypothetical protein